MPIQTYGGFKRMTGFCKVNVPKDIADALESVKDNEEAVKKFGIDLGVQMCKCVVLLALGLPLVLSRALPHPAGASLTAMKKHA